MTYDLEKITKVVRILNLVEDRKRQARDYYFMAATITQKLGRRGEGENRDTYEYVEDGLKICEKRCIDRDTDYIGGVYTGSTIDIRIPYASPAGLHPLLVRAGDIVFYSLSSSEITTYCPGDWEIRFRELYEPLKPKPLPQEEDIELPKMTPQQLKDIKQRFGIN